MISSLLQAGDALRGGGAAPTAQPPGRIACRHCSLPVPAGLIEQNAADQFCCRACRTAFQIIHSAGLERYYDLARATGSPTGAAAQAKGTGSRFEEFDEPAFAEIYCRPCGGTLKTAQFAIEGLHCAACVWLLEKLPAVCPGVASASVQFRRNLLTVIYDPAQVPLSSVARTVDSLGYRPHAAKDRTGREVRAREDRRQLIRIGVAGAIAGNVMVIAFALYGSVTGPLAGEYLTFFNWLSTGLGVLSLCWPGAVFFRNAWAAVRTRSPNLDLPIAMGLLAGGIQGIVNGVLGQGEIYFDSLTVLVFLLLVGRFIQYRQQRTTADAVELLYALTPSTARVLRDGGIKVVPSQSVQVGETVEVLAGDSVPVDGVVITGRSSLDRSIMTGESAPVAVNVDDLVQAGVVNLAAPIRLRAIATGEDTAAAKLMKLVEDGSRSKPGIIQFTDRVAGRFVIGVSIVAVLTLIGWFFVDPAHAVDHAVALLIVTCPCALGLAAPLVFAINIGRAAKRGVLIKGGEVFEKLAQPGSLLLDKTGTLTIGRLSAAWVEGDREALAMAQAVERTSSHPAARAIVSACRPLDLPDLHAQGVCSVLGEGIQATVSGLPVAVGSRAMMHRLGVTVPPHAHAWAELAATQGLSPVMVAVDGRARALFALGDPLRDSARPVIDHLSAIGFKPAIVSGDEQSVVARVGSALGLPEDRLFGGVSPEGKLACVREALQHGPVVMVGDGVNDAAALSASTVGIAVHGGAEASLAAADVYLNRPGLEAVAELVDASHRTLRVVRRTLWASLFYNVVAGSCAVLGVINPIIAAIVMPASSLTVLAIALRSRTFGTSAWK